MEIEITTTRTRVSKEVNNKGKTRTTIRGREITRRHEVLTSRRPKITA